MYVDSSSHDVHELITFSVEIPLNINSDYATYETQFGFVQRPTHKNTTWDIAKVRGSSTFPVVLQLKIGISSRSVVIRLVYSSKAFPSMYD